MKRYEDVLRQDSFCFGAFFYFIKEIKYMEKLMGMKEQTEVKRQE